MYYEKLPTELKIKIMYGGYIKHPIVDLFNDFKKDLMPKDIFNKNENFYDHLCNTGELNTPFHFYIDFDEFIEYIYENHMF